MSEYYINDDWILKRISKQSNSFNDWIQGLEGVIEKSLESIDSKIVSNVMKKKKIPSVNEIKENLEISENQIEETSKQMSQLGLGNIFSNFGQQIQDMVNQEIRSSLKTDFDFNFDFITGKKKSLSTALYDVSKEKGIEETGLLYLIKALPDLEAFLYSTSINKYYRDHTEHALRVAVLGDFILSQDLGHGKLSKVLSDMLELEEPIIREKLWWLTGLLHDIGYPLGKMTTAVNYSLLNQILRCYPTLDLEIHPLQIGLSWKGKLEDYLKILESGISDRGRELFRKGLGSQQWTTHDHTFIAQKTGHSEFNYYEQNEFDHGVISALCFLNGLGTPEEILCNDEYRGYILVAQAIALHSFKEHLVDHGFGNRPLAFLLILIDELQEWGRPIPIKVMDSYFTTDVRKENLLDGLKLHLDEFNWFMEFRNQTAKRLSNFDFNLFSLDKIKSFKRLERGNQFKTTIIHLKDIQILDERRKKESIINESRITI